MIDRFQNFATGLTSPFTKIFAVIPDDDADLIEVPRSLHIGTGGDVRVEMIDGGIETLKNVANGDRLDLRVKRVLSTGTTAADIVAMS